MDRIIECIADALDHMTADLLADKELRRKESELALRRGVIEEVEKAIRRLDNVINGERYKLDELGASYSNTLWVFQRKRGAIQRQIDECSTRIANYEEEKRRVLLNHGMTTVKEYDQFKNSVADLEVKVKQGILEMERAGIRGLFAPCKIDMNSKRLINLACARLNSVSDDDFESLVLDIKKMFEAKKVEILECDELSAEEKENLVYELSYFKKLLGYEDRLRKIRKRL